EGRRGAIASPKMLRAGGGLALGEPLDKLLARAFRRGLRQPERRRNPGWHHRRVPDRLDGPEHRPLVLLVRYVGGELERQPRLAGPAGARERQQAGGREELRRLLQLRLATDEARQLGRQVVGPAVERPDRREVDLEVVDRQLADP